MHFIPFMVTWLDFFKWKWFWRSLCKIKFWSRGVTWLNLILELCVVVDCYFVFQVNHWVGKSLVLVQKVLISCDFSIKTTNYKHLILFSWFSKTWKLQGCYRLPPLKENFVGYRFRVLYLGVCFSGHLSA